MENLRNIVILKGLPSNLIDEAFIILKQNQKIRKLEHIDNKNFSDEKNVEEDNDYIVKEAEFLISNYIEEIDSTKQSINQNIDLGRKCKRLKRLVIALICSLIFAFIYMLLN